MVKSTAVARDERVSILQSGYSRKQVFENSLSVFHVSSDFRHLYRKRFHNVNGINEVIEESKYEQLPFDECGKILQNTYNQKLYGHSTSCNGVFFSLYVLLDKVKQNCVGFILSPQGKENISKSKFYVVKEMIK